MTTPVFFLSKSTPGHYNRCIIGTVRGKHSILILVLRKVQHSKNIT